jgi:hypothetical protein
MDPGVGMSEWLVDGVDQLGFQWFWWRVGSTGPEQRLEQGAATITSQNTSRLAETTYDYGSFAITVVYLLTGGTSGSHVADLAETITVVNNGSTALDLHFFQYADFELGGTAGDDIVERVNANAVRQTETASNFILNETVVSPAGIRWELQDFPNTIDKLDDQDADNLINAVSPLGPGDVTWAFQWDVSIAPSGTFLISKDKRFGPIPEPATMLLVGAGLLIFSKLASSRLRKRA